VTRIDPQNWTMEQVVASPLARPIDVRFHPGDNALYIVDFGWFEMTPTGVDARAGSGTVWRLEGKL
jgi:hypothetical protein